MKHLATRLKRQSLWNRQFGRFPLRRHSSHWRSLRRYLSHMVKQKNRKKRPTSRTSQSSQSIIRLLKSIRHLEPVAHHIQDPAWTASGGLCSLCRGLGGFGGLGGLGSRGAFTSSASSPAVLKHRHRLRHQKSPPVLLIVSMTGGRSEDMSTTHVRP